MKCALTIFISLTFFFATFAQKGTPALPLDSISKKITYTEVVSVDTSLHKSELFSRAREWFAKKYNPSTNVIQMDDKESGKIVGKALTQIYYKRLSSLHPAGYINYTISVYLKDGRYKYEINDFFHTGQYIGDGHSIEDYGPCEEMINTKKRVMGLSYQKAFNFYLSQLDTNIRLLIVSLKESMNTKAIGNKKEDW